MSDPEPGTPNLPVYRAAESLVVSGFARLEAAHAEIEAAKRIMGAQLERARTALNLTASDVARGAQVDVGNLRNVELGRRNFQLPLIRKVLKYLREQAETHDAHPVRDHGRHPRA